MTGIESDDAEADALVSEIKAKQGWEEAELLQRCVELVERLRERIASLSQQNRELRAIIIPLPKEDAS